MFPVRKILRQDKTSVFFSQIPQKAKTFPTLEITGGVTLIADSGVFELAIHHCGPPQQLPFKKESKN